MPPALARAQRTAFLAGGAAFLVLVAGALFDPHQFFRSYLVSFVFWTGVALGCLALVMLQHLTGGAWGIVIRRILEAGASVLPWAALLFVPIAFGVGRLYAWAQPAVVAADPLLQHKAPYLNVPFFLGRAVVYFAIWGGFAILMRRLSAEQDRTGGAAVARKLQLFSGPGIVLYVLTMTFASVDWIMSLEPHWFSTIYGALLVAGQGLGAFAAAITALLVLARWSPLKEAVSRPVLHDLGKLLLAFVMVWAYFSFSQFLIIWSGNLPEETPWYLRRMQGAWRGVALALILFHFALPFVLLLSRELKRRSSTLVQVAGLVFLMRIVDSYWLTLPAFEDGSVRVAWMDPVAVVALGGIFVGLAIRSLRTAPLLPVRDPHLEEALAHAHE
jgi:hypothetical protein